MKVGLKNCVELLSDLVDHFDFALNEECNVWNECDVSIESSDLPYFIIGGSERRGGEDTEGGNAMAVDTGMLSFYLAIRSTVPLILTTCFAAS